MRVAASFAHQIKSEFYGDNWYVYIEGIVLENFSATTQPDISSGPEWHTRHTMFHYFLSDYSKQDASTTAVQGKQIMDLLGKNLVFSLIKIWENVYGYTYH